jgi:BirA family biotin operon repressor/biotin-[acetyl-CoA-carboxylase] ligase
VVAVDEASRSPITWRIRRFDTIDSTNRFVLDEARAGAHEGLVVVADHQDAGRGRRGRSWTAPPGSSLLVSALLRPPLPAERAQLVTMAAGLALAEAVEGVAGFAPSLKWPNDLVVGDRKLAGLLAEADVSPRGDVRAVVVGAGCNVQWDSFPADLAEIATSCNVEAGHPVERDAVLTAYLDRLGERVADLGSILDDYRVRLATLGRDVRVDLGGREVVGTALDVDADGRLLVATPGGGTEVIAAGDVVHLRAT